MTANSLVGEYEYLKGKADKVKALEAAIEKLKVTAADLPPIEEKKQQLEEAIEAHEQEDKVVARKEVRLRDRVQKVVGCRRWVKVAELEEAIDEAKAELNMLRQQLGEKQSLASKLLGRKS